MHRASVHDRRRACSQTITAISGAIAKRRLSPPTSAPTRIGQLRRAECALPTCRSVRAGSFKLTFPEGGPTLRCSDRHNGRHARNSPSGKPMDRSIRRARRFPRWLCALGFATASCMSIGPVQAQELCGGVDYPFPYTDVSGVGAAFCAGIMEAYVTGVSRGTAPTTFSPNETVTRVQMTTFLQRSLDQGLRRNSLRASAEQWWLPSLDASQVVDMGGVAPVLCKPD